MQRGKLFLKWTMVFFQNVVVYSTRKIIFDNGINVKVVQFCTSAWIGVKSW